MSGCSSPQIVHVPTSRIVCGSVEPVCISKDDTLTEGTAQQIEANNLGQAKACKRANPCPQPKAKAPTS